MRFAFVTLMLVMGLSSFEGVTPQSRDRVPFRPDLVGREFDARIWRVADGDTMMATLSDKTDIRIRLEGVDAPELGEPFSSEAMVRLRSLVDKVTVRVRGRDVDNYGRLVARISVGGQDVSTALVRAGLACHAYARDAALAREEAQARASGTGFWAANAKKPACVERTAFSARDAASRATASDGGGKTPTATRASRGFRGNANSKLYHASWCPNYNCRNCNRLFASEAEAKMAGFAPAADCLR